MTAVARPLLLATWLAATATATAFAQPTGTGSPPSPITTPVAGAAAGALGLPLSVAEVAALALSGAAVLLSGAALAVAGSGRRRLAAAAEAAEAAARRPAGPRDGADVAPRIARLETALRDLAAAAPERRPEPSAQDDPPRRDPFPPPTAPPSATPAPLASGSQAAAPGPSEATDFPSWAAELTQAFGRLARDPPSAAAEFIAQRRPCGATAGVDGVALLDAFEGAKLWAVRAPGDGEVWALVPGEQAVLDWSAHFAPRRTQVAAEVFGEAFDLVADGAEALRLEAPALLRRDASGRLSVRRRGRLAGFRS